MVRNTVVLESLLNFSDNLSAVVVQRLRVPSA